MNAAPERRLKHDQRFSAKISGLRKKFLAKWRWKHFHWNAALSVEFTMIRKTCYSICLAIVVTSISYILYGHGGEYVLWPGLFAHVMLNGILLAIPTGDDFYGLPSGSYFVLSVIFYTSAIFALMFLISRVRDTPKT